MPGLTLSSTGGSDALHPLRFFEVGLEGSSTGAFCGFPFTGLKVVKIRPGRSGPFPFLGESISRLSDSLELPGDSPERPGGYPELPGDYPERPGGYPEPPESQANRSCGLGRQQSNLLLLCWRQVVARIFTHRQKHSRVFWTVGENARARWAVAPSPAPAGEGRGGGSDHLPATSLDHSSSSSDLPASSSDLSTTSPGHPASSSDHPMTSMDSPESSLDLPETLQIVRRPR